MASVHAASAPAAVCVGYQGLAVFADDVPHLFDMLPRMQRRPLRGLLALVRMLQRLERAIGACQFRASRQSSSLATAVAVSAAGHFLIVEMRELYA